MDTTTTWTTTYVNSSLHFLPCPPAKSRNSAKILLRIIEDPHPRPLPSDGRGNGYRPPLLNGRLSGQRSRGFFIQLRLRRSALSAASARESLPKLTRSNQGQSRQIRIKNGNMLTAD